MIEKFLVSRHPSLYQAWPDIVLSGSGKLIVTFMRCVHHNDRSYTALCLTESTDRGRSWSEPEVLVEAPGNPYWNCARISKLRDGRLAIVCDRIIERETGASQVFLWFSDDEGDSWQGPFPTPAEGIVPDKLLQLPCGRWLLASHRTSPQHGFLEERLWFSDDQGSTWTGPIVMASKEGLNLCEVSVVPLPDGTLVGYLRENSFRGWDCFKVISQDKGESWHGPFSVPLPGCHRPAAGMLTDELLLITYRFLQGGKGWLGNWTQNFFAALTDVESAKAEERNGQWSRIMPLDYDRSPASDLGYSGWVRFPDGEIYVVNYIVDDWPLAQIRGYSLRLEDFFVKGQGD